MCLKSVLVLKVGGQVRNRGLKIFGILTSIGMVIVLIQGVLVTQTDSGDACGAEWPLCLGQIFPDSPTVETMIEYSHRAVTALVGLMVLTLVIWSWRKLKSMNEVKFFATISIFFIILQSLLGAAAVLWEQTDEVMALHFGFSLMSVASVVILTIFSFEYDFPRKKTILSLSSRMKYYLYFLFVYLYVVVYTGAYVKHTDSAAACSGWPLCNDQLIPPLEGGAAIQFGHRLATALLFIFILILFSQVWKKYRQEKVFFFTTALSLLLVVIQIFSGAILIFTGFTLAATMFHAVFLSLLFVTIFYLIVLAYRSANK